MLIKQWSESQAARHVLDNEDEFQKEPLVPQVTVSLDKETLFEHVLIIPNSIAIITQTLAKSEVGQITVRYPQLEPADTEEEFDDEEQLYSAAAIEASRRKFPDTDSPLYAVSGADNAQILIAVVPHFTNPIAEKKVASEITKIVPSAKTWLALAPCQLNNGASISKLDLSPILFPNVPLLKPPHFITGISAAIISALAKKGDLENAAALALNSEGHPGFEKVDADAIMDAAYEIFQELLDHEDAEQVLKKLSGTVRKINSSSTSGMYL
ncbi:hypothetical protein OY671_005344 [Metschnikowia pulcherrima]|nr:hypothetical protein OY671_005344 [Metschnikowia pulcherrima]